MYVTKTLLNIWLDWLCRVCLHSKREVLKPSLLILVAAACCALIVNAQTDSNVALVTVYPHAGAQFAVDGHQLVGEQIFSDGTYYVHGLSRGDLLSIAAPGGAMERVFYEGDPLRVDLPFSVGPQLPSPPTMSFMEFSATPPSATIWRGQIFYASSQYWPEYPVAFGQAGGAYRWLLPSTNGGRWDSTTTGIALATFHDLIYLAYAGVNNDFINITSTQDSGRTFSEKVTLPYKTKLKPNLCACGNKLLLTFASQEDGQINTLESPDGVTWSTHRTLPAFAKGSPYAVRFAGTDYIAFVGGTSAWNQTDQIRLLKWNGTAWEFGPVLSELTNQGPTLSVIAGRMAVVWQGTDSKKLVNILEFDGNLNAGVKTTYNFSTSTAPIILPYAFSSDRTHTPTDLPLLFYTGPNGGFTFTRFFDDGSFAPANGTFESGLISWTPFSPEPGFTPHTSDFSADGAQSLELDQPGLVFQDVGGLIPGKTYVVSVLVAGAADNSGASGHLSLHDTEGANYAQSPDVSPGGEWQEVSSQFVATETGSMRVHLVRNGGSPGPIYFDSVRVETDQ